MPFLIGYRCATACAFFMLLQGCASTSPEHPSDRPSGESSVLEGWEYCAFACEKSFVSGYSTLNVIRVDGQKMNSRRVTLTPGRHWIEAHYAWGGGILGIGFGNYKNYGFEFDFIAGHRYKIRDLPDGCLVPLKGAWVSLKTLIVEDQARDSFPVTQLVKAMEYCSVSESSGSCKSALDCTEGLCTSLGGSTGYGFCGDPR